MTRIIAGFAGSQTLSVPRAGTRPTSDRVREAIFSALDARDAVRGGRVLDLYAGSGALGLEAASRGAVAVTLVEKNSAAALVCRRNTTAILSARPRGSELTVEVTSSPVQAFLGASATEFDLVFIDPPYELGEPELLQNLEALVPRLAPYAIVAVERSTRSPRPSLPPGLELDRRKDYGETTLWWLSPVAADQ